MGARWSIPIAVVIAVAATAHAQTALVRVLHDHPGSAILPGETLSIRVVVSWEGAQQFAGLRGDAIATDSLGVAANVGSEFGHAVPPLRRYGVAVGGDVLGHDIATVPAFFLGSPEPITIRYTGVDYLTYDWTAPNTASPTLVEFRFVPDPIAPNVRLYPGTSSVAFVEAQTTYAGTSILVIPAPGGFLPLSACGLLAARRVRMSLPASPRPRT